MKQGINFILPVQIDYNLDHVESIQFVFAQKIKRNTVKISFFYPSMKAVRQGHTDTVNLIWDKHDTFVFSPDYDIQMDTRIKVLGTQINPQTQIKTMKMNPTLFDEQ